MRIIRFKKLGCRKFRFNRIYSIFWKQYSPTSSIETYQGMFCCCYLKQLFSVSTSIGHCAISFKYPINQRSKFWIFFAKYGRSHISINNDAHFLYPQ
jgi:hypothetical protein